MSANKPPGNIFDGTQRQLKQKEEKLQKQQVNVKLDPSLAPPYAQKWPDIKKQHHKMIMDEILTTFKNKVIDQKTEQQANKLKKKNPDEAHEKFFERLSDVVGRNPCNAGKNVVKLLAPFHKADSTTYLTKRMFKQHVTVGYRDISKAIEKKQKSYSLVICCSGEPQKLICQDLLCQCLLNGIPICAVDGFDDRALLDWLDFRNMTAIGFHKSEEEENPFSDLVEFVVDKVPDIPTPWMKLWKEEEEKQNLEVYRNIGNDDDDTSNENKKRKLEPESDDNKESDVQYIEPNIEWVKSKKKSGGKK